MAEESIRWVQNMEDLCNPLDKKDLDAIKSMLVDISSRGGSLGCVENVVMHIGTLPKAKKATDKQINAHVEAVMKDYCNRKYAFLEK